LPLTPNLRGALFMSISMAGFTLNDAIVKGVLENMNVGQVMLIRGIFASALIAALAWHQNALAAPKAVLHPMVALRVVCEVGATISFVTALAYLPLANISAILQALPLAVTVGAALFLAEPVGWRRWLAILVGFTGVMIIVRPGYEGFNVYALSALLCVAFCAVRDLATMARFVLRIDVSRGVAVILRIWHRDADRDQAVALVDRAIESYRFQGDGAFFAPHAR
jgi:drug/metabolite transporter (DMT)-like permease